ncbi:carboxypeptidase-like regulatory domain-containing protein [Winogradskyella sp. F6397]|uniref:Carboxypeptidase-like regulatory domain-containing protein n=1 Tax=Winogradskyella marina TaxID=2785530 RepID=A0ABS0EJ27_9FLAO|nr:MULTISPECIES: carboxypeptidase-like regulatory domain-containing protein [Winogradskyella]MBF8148661.1 carboxypeptidase-like regulatory domain-containing protein [Winogradskyella marina]
MKINQIIIALTLFLTSQSYGQQTFSSTLLDSKTEKPIPFASIQFNSKTGVISNDQGEFNISINRAIKATDSLMISCLGYEEKRIPLLNFNQSTILLTSKSVDLSEVLVTNKNYSIDEILDKIKEGLTLNYDFSYNKRKLFYRTSYYTDMDKYDVILEKSTIPEFNQQFIDSLLLIMPKSNSNHTEVLGELYGEIEPEASQKMDILKACRLYDKSKDINLDNYEKRFNDIFKKYVKRDSYFKIKSGWFSVKEEMDSSLFGDTNEKEEAVTDALLAEQQKKDSIRKIGFLHWRKMMIHKFENNNFIDDDNDLNFIHKSRRYEFEIADYAYINNMFVYVIPFKPKRSEDFSGTMYVNTEDFAVIRVDYKNVKPLSKFSLLGISMKKYLKEGTIIFQKNDNDKYTLKYRDESLGQRVGIKRPFKIVEKNKNVKGRRKQNELKGDIHFIVRNIEKTELVVFETNSISESDFKNFKEKPQVSPTQLNQYDPEFWKGYNIIEPNKAIKDFKVLERE